MKCLDTGQRTPCSLNFLTEFRQASLCITPRFSFRVPSVTGYPGQRGGGGEGGKFLKSTNKVSERPLVNFQTKKFFEFLRIILSIKENHYLLDLLNPEIHSSKNSKVRCGSLAASVLLIETIKRVLLAGMHNPDVSSNWPSIFKLKVQVKAHRRL